MIENYPHANKGKVTALNELITTLESENEKTTLKEVKLANNARIAGAKIRLQELYY